MDPDSLLIIFISLLFSAFFSGMEIAFVASNKFHLELMKKRGEFNARILTPFLNDPSRFIATMLVGNNIALVVYGIEMAKSLEPYIRQIILLEWGVILTQTVISSAVVLVTAEFIPKVLFSINANRFIRLFAIPAWISYYTLYSIVSLVVASTHTILRRLLRVEQIDEKRVFGRVDLQQYLEEHATKSSKEEVDSEIQIFQNALDFSEVKARECMIPRNEIIAMEINEDIGTLRDRFVETGLSKIVIYRESVDQIIGFTHSYELFKNPKDIRSILLPIALVAETTPANDILNLFLNERKSIALVVDEFGGVSGLLTVEDVVEEIFGEIEDEHDKVDKVETKLSDREYVFSGRLEIDYLNEKYQLNLPESNEYETLSGLVVSCCEKIPEINEEIEIEGFSFEILEVNKTKIELVQLSCI